MKQFYVATFLLIFSFARNEAAGQDFSNRGKDFWVAYGYHQQMTNNMVPGGTQDMVLYFAAEQNANVTISIPGIGYTFNLAVPANSIVASPTLPKNPTGQDARLLTEGVSNKGIHITSDVPVVAYSHIYNQSVSGASILYPTNTLGKEYYSINYANNSNTPNSNCWFYVVATDTGTTTVEITPTANTVGGWTAGNTYTVTLTQGQVYNVMGVLINNNAPPPYTAVDLTGSRIRSVASGSGGCKRIAVFSGSGRIAISCNGSTPSSDNYMSQALPKAAWGKKYLTTPIVGFSVNNGNTGSPSVGTFYRVCVSNPATNVTVNGAPIGLPLINNFYYQINATTTPMLIEADSAITVAQYFPSQGNTGCPGGSNGDGDPELIYLSPVEQGINKVVWNASARFQINPQKHYINVVIRNTGTALSSFRLDGAPVAASSWLPHPGDPNYLYARFNVSGVQGNPTLNTGVPHVVQSDSNFNAIAYGYGGAESYGYNAGTNIKDLYQFITIQNQYGTVNFPATCQNSPFRLSMVFPYQPLQIQWIFGPALNAMGFNDTTLVNPVFDSSWVVNGRTLYRYRLPRTYSIGTPGTYSIRVVALNPTPDGCGNEQIVDFDVQVFSPPDADFTFTNNCLNDTVYFTDASNPNGRPVISWYWNFDDGNTANTQHATHVYPNPGTYNVRHSLITDIGCVSDTAIYPVNIDSLPVASFTAGTPGCVNQPVAFTDQSYSSGAPLQQWTWNFGDGSPPVVVVAPNPPNQTHIYTIAGTYNATLQVENADGCESVIDTVQVVVRPDATISLTSAPGSDNQTVCINTAITTITYAVGGSSTGASVTGLPAGVTGTYSAGVFTISGTPTVSGTFTYTVTTSGPCATPNASGTITVNPDGTINLTSAPGTDNQTVCINTPITPITYAVGGSGTGGNVSGLPAGVTGTFSGGIITISGSPTVSGTFNYSVSTTGPCVTPGATGIINVTADGTLTLTSAPGTNNQTVCINTPITNITYSVGGSGTGGSVSGLPAGVTGTFSAGVITISGTPTVSGTFNYTVSTTGPCATPTAGGTITVTADATITLTSAPGTENQTVCINTPITPITYAVGGSGTGGSVSGLPAGVTGVFSGGVITISGTPTVSGTFNYAVNITGPCVTPTASGTINVTADGTITLTSAPGTDNQTVCINTPITNITYSVGGSGTGGSVSGLPAGVSGVFSGGVITISGTPTVSGTFNYSVSTTGPCVAPGASGTITVTPDATIQLTSPPATTNQEVCINSAIANITYAIGGSGAGATVTGLPAGVNGVYSSGVFTISGTPTVSGTFNYTVTASGPCQPATASGTIVVNPLPTANFSYTIPTCETRVITFTDLSVPNAGNLVSWSWDFGDGNTSTNPSPTHVYAASGTYNVTLIVTTDKGCVSAPRTQAVTVNVIPVADFLDPEVCLSDTYAQFWDASTVPSGSITGWLWNFGDPGSGPANTSTLQNPQHSYSAVGVYLVTLIVTTNNGCTDTVAKNITVSGDIPHAVFTPLNPANMCANDSVSIQDGSTVNFGNITKVEIYWDFVNQPTVFDTDNNPVFGKIYRHLYPNFQTPLTRSFTIRYRAFSGGTCVDDTLITITVNAAPLVQFNNMPDVCLDAAPFQITQASETGGVPGSGVFSGPGVTPGGIFNPASVGPGTYTITYTYTSSAGGCVDSASNTITVLEPPVADFTVSAPACEEQAVTFSDNSNAPVGTLTTWTWNFGDGTPVVVRTNNSPFPHTFAAYGTYQVRLRVTTDRGCNSAEKVIPVTVNPLPRPNFTYPAASCLPNANVTFNNSTTIADGTAMTYVWDFGDPGSGSNNNSTATNPSHTYTTTGPFSVNLQATSANGCINDTTITLNSIHPQPTALFDVDKTDVCIGGSFRFTDRSDPADGTTTQWTWTMGDGNTRTTPSFTYTYANPGSYDVSLQITNSWGCPSTVFTRRVNTNPYPSVNAGPDKFVLEGGVVQLTPTISSTHPVTYLWTPPTWLSNPTVANPNVMYPTDDITYTLTVTTDRGCSRTDQVFVKVLKAPIIPNIFSPNGDGVHDTWVIGYLESYPGATVEIYNRYGQLVYRSAGIYVPWDGTINGKPAPVGTYYYIVNPKNGRKIMSGFVDLIR
ncbi:MAG TPA: PKD domain-containing protein [Chitinophagaceae bacterium]|nr:PKD domain-containing protein [Chitinophagaceae bacterium]